MTSCTSFASFLISSSSFPSLCFAQTHSITCKQRFPFPSVKGRRKFSTLPFSSTKRLVTRAAEYKFPDPIPEFADAETQKFKSHLLKKLSKKDMYGESIEEVVGICTENRVGCVLVWFTEICSLHWFHLLALADFQHFLTLRVWRSWYTLGPSFR
ncbi:protein PLASTID REDOX INSENSITIVE 2, chloroplastic-like isoform X1 [Glycine max]|uniref:protein PLASTID REDOX INSENSITIVE 2, chloroplastic-like isoform X1 n=1 Tax=Glycine max TaxID=3847 RepID=UPI001B354EB4|nr:uncharacterized protein LOC100306067 isoform X1 [Glycine max]